MTTLQRAHPRYDVCLSAEVTSDTRRFTATTRNLSTGGCCVEGVYGLTEGSAARLDLFIVVDGIEDERMPPLSIQGIVQWSAETDGGSHATGIQFQGMTHAQTQWLQTFLTRIDHA